MPNLSINTKPKVNSQNLVITIFLNIGITLAQIIGGFVSGSLALISDALHNFTDVLSLVFSYVAHRLSKRKASINHTFGYKRAEILAAFVNGISLLVLAFFLIYEAVKKIYKPVPIDANIVIWLSALGILFNGLSVFLLKKDAQNSLNMRSAYYHLLTDMLASVGVLVGGILMRFYEIFWIDGVLTILIAFYLIFVSYDLVKKSTKFLMLFTPDHIDIKEIVREVHQINGVGKLHHIHVWYLNEEELHLEAHLDCEKNIQISEFNELLFKIEKLLFQKFGINHVNIQPEFQKVDPKEFIVQD